MSRIVRFTIWIVAFVVAVLIFGSVLSMLALVITGATAGWVTGEPGIYFLEAQPEVLLPGIGIALVGALMLSFLFARILPALIMLNIQTFSRKSIPAPSL